MLGWYLRNAQTRALSHPLPVMRAREIDRWSQSQPYKVLLSKNRSVQIGTAAEGVAGSPGVVHIPENGVPKTGVS